MKTARFTAKWANGEEIPPNTEIWTFRDEKWILGGTSHPRKIWVFRKNDPNGPGSWPNKQTMEYYPSVFDGKNGQNIGIWDNELAEWSFKPTGLAL